MKRTIILAAVVVAAASLAFGHTKSRKSRPRSKDVQVLEQMQRDWSKAVLNRDTNALKRIIAEDFVITDSDGNVGTRAACLAELKSGVLALDSAGPEDIKVKMYGNMAVITERLTAQGTYRGAAYLGPERVTVVAVKRNGRWQVISSHASRITKR
jgi:ketosteroid isomerase-like protein